MMDWWGFTALAAVLVVIPGPAVTLVMKRSVVSGRSAAVRTALGVLSADMFWVAASVVGLTAVIVASQPAFQALRLVGAAYLCWLGVGLLLRRRHGKDAPADNQPAPRVRIGPFTEGVLCDLSNPKTLLVFTSVIPQFLPADGGHPIQGAALGVTFALLGFVSLLVFALLFSRIGIEGLQTRVGDALLRIGGFVLVVFGVRLAIEPSK